MTSNLPFVNWEKGSLRNGLAQLDLDVPVDGLPLRSIAPGRDEVIAAVVAEAGLRLEGLTQELRLYSATGALLATATRPALCTVCK